MPRIAAVTIALCVACGSQRAPGRADGAGPRAEDAAPRGAATADRARSDAGDAAPGEPDAGDAAPGEPGAGDGGVDAGAPDADSEIAAADGGVPAYVEVEGDLALFPLHAVATSLEVKIYSSPRSMASRVGYLRNGARMRVGPPIRGGGCGGAWHELPTGGFVCARDGLEVRSGPVARPSAPPPPCMSCPLPYEYGFTRLASTPMLARLPDLDETRVIDEIIADRERASGTAPTKQAGRQPSDAQATSTSDGGEAAPPTAAPPDGGGQPAPLPAPPAQPTDVPSEVDATEGPPSAAEQRRAPSVSTWLERGFFVSINRLIGAKNRRLYFKTVYGRYVPENRVFRFTGFSPFQGVRVDAGHPLPIYFVKSPRAFLDPAPGTRGLERVRADRLTLLDVTGREGRAYRLASGHLVERSWVARIDRTPPPPDLVPGEKWIDVDLSEQTLVAYQGDTPILATMVSTGKEGFDTPSGDFRIKSKHVATTMDGNTATDGPYSIEDVPWTMYFHRSYALHGAFWHRQYGIARSHGCVNLSPNDARFLFDWTQPALPPGWHGVFATRENPGTRVIVHE
ncbi:MAG: L,D-transpeptidase [Deltaproteobacteria bacterium]|nr:L,D-transpeptidase [Deltaproteobacteria bacterium]